jgi:CheY-like chemotaxis protein
MIAANEASLRTDIVDLVTGLAWPVVVGLVLWKLLPTVVRVIASRGFTVTAGGMTISVQEASQQLADRLEDVREQVSSLKAKVAQPRGEEAATVSPISSGLSDLRSVLWVDDYPENNAFEVESLDRKGVRVVQARSTDEALRILESRSDVDAVITDMGRREDGVERPDAGIELTTQLRARRPELPVLVYASAPAVARSGEGARAAGATFVTSSATELLDELGRIGLR